MNTERLNQILDEMYEAWLAMTGVDPDAKSFTIGSYELQKRTEEILEVRELDPSGVVPFMLVRAFIESFIADTHVTALEVIRGLSPKKEELFASFRRVLKVVERPEVDEIVQAFLMAIRQATRHYGIDREDLDAWFAKEGWMGTLLRDALKSMQRLKAHQFCWGDPAPEGSTLKYSTKVFEFWNMPSLVRTLRSTKEPSITLCLIRDPEDALQSFFCIAIVNGDNLTVLTDRKRGVHPDFKRMARRPDRDLERRASEHWFPYNLLELVGEGTGEETDDGARLRAKERKGLVNYQTDKIILGEFKSIPPASAIWLTLLFDLIRTEYFDLNKRLPTLSYTTEMVREPDALLERDHALVVSGQYQPLAVTSLTHEDVSAEATAEQWEMEPLGFNEWMIERYGHLVPTSVFNLVGKDDLLALPGEGRDFQKEVAFWNKPVYPAEWSETEKALAAAAPKLKVLDPIDFGTKEEIERDRKWAARANLCKVVQKLADQEYDDTVKTIFYRKTSNRDTGPRQRGWYYDRIMERKDWLIEHAVRGELYVTPHWNYDYSGFDGRKTPKPINMVHAHQGGNKNDDGLFRPYGDLTLSDYVHPKGYLCAVTGAVASYHAVFSPPDFKGLAVLLGCDVEDLPWQLRHWMHSTPYKGNCILERLDPSDWMLHNPWEGTGHHRKLGLRVGVSLSKRAVNALRKKLGLPPMVWEV